MCSHPDHEVSERADGSVAETHVLTDEQMAELTRWRTVLARYESTEAA